MTSFGTSRKYCFSTCMAVGEIKMGKRSWSKEMHEHQIFTPDQNKVSSERLIGVLSVHSRQHCPSYREGDACRPGHRKSFNECNLQDNKINNTLHGYNLYKQHSDRLSGLCRTSSPIYSCSRWMSRYFMLLYWTWQHITQYTFQFT